MSWLRVLIGLIRRRRAELPAHVRLSESLDVAPSLVIENHPQVMLQRHGKIIYMTPDEAEGLRAWLEDFHHFHRRLK